MAQQTINLGAAPDDGTGDTLRVGGDKINDNFTELYTFDLGFGTGSSPQFAGINLGHASDTTITRVSAGVAAIEGVNIVTTAGGVTFAADIVVPDEAYDATAWNGSLEVPTKNAIRDKIETISGGATTLDGLTDVNAPTPANNDVLTWDSTPGEWVAAAPAGGSFTAASTTEILTGTDTTKGGTPDSIAALWEQGSDVASAGTISLGEGGYFNITGTTTITDIDFGTDKAGRKAWVQFAGALTLTHNASTLILPTGANITTAAGDTACFVSEGSDAVRCVAYNRASGAALTSTGGSWSLLSSTTIAAPTANIDVNVSAYNEVMVIGRNVTTASSATRGVVCSTDGGSTFYNTSGNYVTVSTAGVEANQFICLYHGTATTSARSFGGILWPIKVANAPKWANPTCDAQSQQLFVADDANPITHIRVCSLAASGGALINLTAGSVYVFGR